MTMKNNPENLNPTSPCKSYNPFESEDETTHTLGIDSKTANSKDDHVGFDLKEFEQSASPLTFLDDSLCEDGEPFDKNVPTVSKDIGVDEGAKKVSHDQVDVLEDPKLGDTLVKKEKENSSDKEDNVLVHPHEVMNQNEENQMTKSNNNIAFGFNSPTNSDPRKKEDNLQTATTRHDLPSSVTFSSPVTYAGSVSIRSESSTTSTRSFAFPVLQNEWNSSPVRMAEADRRRSRSRRSWLMELVCCRSF